MMLTLALHNFGIVASDEAENDMEIKGKGNPRIVTYAFQDWAYISTPLALPTGPRAPSTSAFRS